MRPSAFWRPSACARPERTEVRVVESTGDTYSLLSHAPVLELRADTVS